MAAGRVLVVDDEPLIVEMVTEALTRQGYKVESASTGPEALALAERGMPDVIVLDIMLPGLDGLEVCRRLRSKSDVPIIILSAKTEEIDRVVGLELGADDYLPKPFSPRELVARIRAVLRRAERAMAKPASPGALEFPGLTLDMRSRSTMLDGEPIRLTRKEFNLLFQLASEPKRVFSREELLKEVWGEASAQTGMRTVDTHIKRLRRKLGHKHDSEWRLETVWGIGYRFQVLKSQTASDVSPS